MKYDNWNVEELLQHSILIIFFGNSHIGVPKIGKNHSFSLTHVNCKKETAQSYLHNNTVMYNNCPFSSFINLVLISIKSF